MNDIQIQTMSNDLKRGYYNDGVKSVLTDLENIKNNYLMLGFHLRQIQEFKWYKYKYGESEFERFCKMEFNFSKSTVYRLIEINKRFCIENSSILADKFSGFGKSQLEEMLSMTDEDLDYVSPDMTIKEIRVLKSYETHTPDTAENVVEGQYKIANEDCKVVEETSVATSQQDDKNSHVSIELLLDEIVKLHKLALNDDSCQGDYASGYLTAIREVTTIFYTYM